MNNIQVANIDKSQSLQIWLKNKFLKELLKGVSAMKQYIYPSVLQKECLMVLKKSDSKNVIIRYSPMSGIKLTLFLPIVNHQIKHVISKLQNESNTITYSMILCNSNARC